MWLLVLFFLHIINVDAPKLLAESGTCSNTWNGVSTGLDAGKMVDDVCWPFDGWLMVDVSAHGEWRMADGGLMAD